MRIKKTEHFASYEQAKEFIKSVNIKSKVDYFEKAREFRKQGVICLPATPSVIYKDKWVSWSDYLSKNKSRMSAKARRGAKFLSYEDAKSHLYKFAVDNNVEFKSGADFKRFAKTPLFLENLSMVIPIAAYAYYSHTNEWKSWEDFLSVHTFGTMSYDEMRALFRENSIDSMDRMFEFCAEHPEHNISSDIESSCKMRGDWKGWENLFLHEEHKPADEKTEVSMEEGASSIISMLTAAIEAIKKLSSK